VNSFLGHNTVALFRILDNPDSFWLKKFGGKEKILKEGLKAGIDWLKLNYGLKPKNWVWGKVHAITFPHAMSAQPPLDKIFNIGPYPIGGDTDTPWQTFIMSQESFDGELASASYRQIIDMSDLDKSQIIMPLGNSGNMASPYYKNQLRMWFNGEFIPMAFSRSKVEEFAKHTLWLKKN
jgi:penicillin amidase